MNAHKIKTQDERIVEFDSSSALKVLFI